MRDSPVFHLTVLVAGHKYAISDCAHWRLDAEAVTCAEGFDLKTHKCLGCAKYAKRKDDPFRKFREHQSWMEEKRKENGGAGILVSRVSVTVPGTTDETSVNQPPPSLWDKAKSWIKAEASVVTQGKLPDEQYEARIAACRACEHLDVRTEPQVGFCKACGCGTGSRAELTVKGRMPAAKCPKGKWPALPAK